MVNYPAQIDTTQSLPTVVDNFTPVQGAVFNRLRDAVLAVESELGTTPSGIYATVGARLNTLETNLNNLQIIELAGDLGGTLISPKVIGLQGRPLSNAAPVPNQVLAWNGISWGPSNVPAGGDLSGNYPNPTVAKINGHAVSSAAPTDTYVLTWVAAHNDWEPSISFNAGGDLSGTLTNQNVINIHGASVPIAGALVPGNVLQVLGHSSLTYAPVNLAGGSNFVSGVLPLANMSTQVMGGDVTGFATSSTVARLQGNAISNAAPSTNQTLAWSGTNWAPSNVPAGADLSGTYPNPNVSSIQGLDVLPMITAAANEVVQIGYNPVWQFPYQITWDAPTTTLWVASQGDNFVSQVPQALGAATNYPLPVGYNAYSISASGGGFIAVGTSAFGPTKKNRLVLFNSTTGAIVGLGLYPSSVTPTAIAWDDTGHIWTVDGTNVQKFNALGVLFGYPNPVAPVATIAIAGCADITFGVTSGGHHDVFVTDGTHSHIYSIDTGTNTITGTYTDGSLRDIEHIYFGGGVSALWATTGTDNHLLRLNPDTMTLTATISPIGTPVNMGFIGSDGSLVYVSDLGGGQLYAFDPGSNSATETFQPNVGITATPGSSITAAGGMAFDNVYMNVCQSVSSPHGYQGIAKFIFFCGSTCPFFIGPPEMTHIPYDNFAQLISWYPAFDNTIPFRGSTGEAIFTSLWENTTGVASSGFIRTTGANESIIAAQSQINPSNNLNIIGTNGSDGVLVGDGVNTVQARIQSVNATITLTTAGITSNGGKFEGTTVLGTGGGYNIVATDRIVLYTGSTGGRVVDLPASTGFGRVLTIANGPLGSNINPVFILPNGTDRIGGTAVSSGWFLQGGDSFITLQDNVAGTWSIISASYRNNTPVEASAYNIKESDNYVQCNTGGGAFTVTLPASPLFGERHEIIDVGGSAGTNNITIARNGNTINGSASNVVVNVNYGKKTLTFLGSPVGWHSSSTSP